MCVCMCVHAVPAQPVSADDFMPAFVYVTACSVVPDLPSQLVFIRTFANPQVLQGQADYYFSCLEFAVEYLKQMMTLESVEQEQELEQESDDESPDEEQAEEEDGDTTSPVVCSLSLSLDNSLASKRAAVRLPAPLQCHSSSDSPSLPPDPCSSGESP